MYTEQLRATLQMINESFKEDTFLENGDELQSQLAGLVYHVVRSASTYQRSRLIDGLVAGVSETHLDSLAYLATAALKKLSDVQRDDILTLKSQVYRLEKVIEEQRNGQVD